MQHTKLSLNVTYTINIKNKYDHSKERNKKREYDTWMYGPESPHKDAKTIDWEGTDVYKKFHSPEKLDDLSIDDDQLLRQGIQNNTEKLISMSKQDEIIFNILKWIFSAIKQDEELVAKDQLIDQLRNNSDTLKSLGFYDFEDFKTATEAFETNKTTHFTWDEFIDFFMSKSGLGDAKSEWWKNFLTDMDSKDQRVKDANFYNSPEQKANRLTEKAYLRSSDKNKIDFAIDEQDEQKLKLLTGSRVEQAKYEGYDTAADELDIFKNKPKCLLLDSHIALLEELFNKMDKYEDYILIRLDFIHALRNDEKVKLFLNNPAVKLPKTRKTLTFDEVL